MADSRNIITKLIASHRTDGQLVAGNTVSIRIDQTLLQDATGTMAFLELEAMGVDRVKTELSVQYIDHNTSQFGPENQNDHIYLQSVAAAKGAYFSRPGNGICHQVHLERFGVPGKTMLGSDSHTPTNGGLGMLAIGAGGLDVASAMGGVPFTMTMPKVIGVKLTGELPDWVAAKDIVLYVLSKLGTQGNVGCALEYFGPGVKTLSVPERATITNMGAELGVTTSVFPSDEITREFLRAEEREQDWQSLEADADAEYDEIMEIDLSSLEPLVSCPSSPGNVARVSEIEGMPVTQVIIGSCTNSSLKDMSTVANLLTGKQVAPSSSLCIAPGSRQVLQMLARNGGLEQMFSAGARILESACGPCIGQGLSPASDTVTVRTFNRNFPGRTGTSGDQCYLVSAETAAATALNGNLTDPRRLEEKPVQWDMPERFVIDDSMIIDPPSPEKAPEIVRPPTIGAPPEPSRFPTSLDGEVLIKAGDKITTDHIMPAGTYLKLRSNIEAYSKVVFSCFNEEGEPTFAEKAARVRDEGRHGVIVAGESYGQGSSREHAAICPMHLGVRVVLAISIERIHRSNLINFGILPLTFSNPRDYDEIEQGDKVIATGIHENLRENASIVLEVRRNDNTTVQVECSHALSESDIETVLAGGRLNTVQTAGKDS
mgnify:CR=1 FL=1